IFRFGVAAVNGVGPRVVACEEVTTQGHHVAVAEGKALLGCVATDLDERASGGGVAHGAMLRGLHFNPARVAGGAATAEHTTTSRGSTSAAGMISHSYHWLRSVAALPPGPSLAAHRRPSGCRRALAREGFGTRVLVARKAIPLA